MKYLLRINNRFFSVEVDDEDFFKYLEKNKQADFGNNEYTNEKDLLLAYIKKTSELYEKEKKMNQLLKKLELDLSKISV